MNRFQDDVPMEFYHESKPTPKVMNVGELIDQLKRLPKDLPIKQNYPEIGASLVVFNIRSDVGLSLEEVDWD